jgi:hypothetical protein
VGRRKVLSSDVPPPDTSPRFQLAPRLTAFGARASFTFTLALVVADIASQLGSPHQRGLWFGIAGGTAALGFWKMWGWILRRVGIE